MRKPTYALLLLLMMATTACEVQPTKPSAPTVTVLFSGTIWELGPANTVLPSKGASISWCDIGACRGTSTTSRSDGSYSIEARNAWGGAYLKVNQWGQLPISTKDSMVTTSGAVTLDFQLKPDPDFNPDAS